MYQPGGVVGNKSIAVSKLMGSSGIDGLAGKSLTPHGQAVGKSALGGGSTRKVEGHDLAKSKGNFEQTVSNLKSKPNQKVLED
jgi:hypothetical protein